jgi:heparanase 1
VNDRSWPPELGDNGRVRTALAVLIACGCSDSRVHVAIDGSATAATVSDRFLSVAIDTAQLVGGNWWTPGQTAGGGVGPVPKFDFGRARLIALARPLGHAWLRLGGTDADRTYYAIAGAPPSSPPPNYSWILDAAQIDAASSFAAALDFELLFTLNAGPGPRNAGGPWLPDDAHTLTSHATGVGVWELGNEVDGYRVVFGLGLSAADYARDLATARTILPTGSRLAGPASAYFPLAGEATGFLPAFVKAGGSAVDVLTWHYYPQESARCPAAVVPASPTALLDPFALDEIDRWADEVEMARASGAPQAEAWLDETGNAQCGGAPGVSDVFVSSLWWLDELGKMARRGTPVVVRQSLTGADYGLIAEPSLEARPDYFASLLWRQLMSERVLRASVAKPSLRVYAHCARGSAGATLLAINLDAAQPIDLAVDGVGGGAQARYLVGADSPTAPIAKLGDQPLQVAADGTPPALTPQTTHGATLTLPSLSYAFVVFPEANLAACR